MDKLIDDAMSPKKALTAAPYDLPLDFEHEPADLPEAIEMLRRAKRRIEDLEISLDAERDLSGAGNRP